MTDVKKINWPEILLFYVIAVGVSAPFRLRLVDPQLYFPLPDGLSSLYYVLRGIGPWVGFIAMFYIFKSKVKRNNDFWGLSKPISLISALIIPAGLVITGLPDENGNDNHYIGFIRGITLVLYALVEEYGWRGYLQEALAPMKTPLKVFVIGTLWYIWHLNFLLTGLSIEMHLIHYASLLAGAWGLLMITKVSRSILFASAVHLSFNLLADVPGDFNKRLTVLLVAVAVWVVLMRLLQRKIKNNTSPLPGFE